MLKKIFAKGEASRGTGGGKKPHLRQIKSHAPEKPPSPLPQYADAKDVAFHKPDLLRKSFLQA